MKYFKPRSSEIGCAITDRFGKVYKFFYDEHRIARVDLRVGCNASDEFFLPPFFPRLSDIHKWNCLIEKRLEVLAQQPAWDNTSSYVSRHEIDCALFGLRNL